MADDSTTAGPDDLEGADPPVPARLAAFERDYVEAINAVLAAADGNSADAHRWRGHAEAYRAVCQRIRRDLGLPDAAYTSAEWRAAHGVSQPDYPATDPAESARKRGDRRTDPSGATYEWTGLAWRMVTRAELDREAWERSRRGTT